MAKSKKVTNPSESVLSSTSIDTESLAPPAELETESSESSAGSKAHFPFPPLPPVPPFPSAAQNKKTAALDSSASGSASASAKGAHLVSGSKKIIVGTFTITQLLSRKTSHLDCPFIPHDFEGSNVQFTNVLISYEHVNFSSDILLSITSFLIQHFSLRCAVKNYISTFVFNKDSEIVGRVNVLLFLSKRLTLSSSKLLSYNGLDCLLFVISKKDLGIRYVVFNFNGTNEPTQEFFLTNLNLNDLNNIAHLQLT